MLGDDVLLAETLVRRAAEVAVACRTEGVVAEAKFDAIDVVTEADRRAEAAVVALLAEHRPHDGVHGEEGSRAAGSGRVWFVDAIDGTLNFVRGTPLWCSAIALVEDGQPTASAVWDPVHEQLFSAEAGRGANLDRSPLHLPPGPPLSEAAVGTYANASHLAIAGVGYALLAAEAGALRATGSGTLELAWVAAGRLDGWAQPDVAPWDWCPGALLVREAGGHAERLEGPASWCVAGSRSVAGELADLLGV